MHQLADGGSDGVDFFVGGGGQGGIVGAKPRLLYRFALHRADPAIQNQRQRAALRLCFGGEVGDQLAVGGKPLPFCPLQPPFGGEVGVRHDKAPVHHIAADGLQQEALAAAVAPDDKAEGRAALRNNVHVVKQRFDLVFPPHRDIRQADARHHAALQRIQHRLRNALRYFFMLLHRLFLRVIALNLPDNPRPASAGRPRRSRPYRRSRQTGLH